MAEATVVRVKATIARESTLQAGETSKVAVNEETTKGRERTAKGGKQRRLSVKMARFEAKSRGGGYTKEVTRLCSQEKSGGEGLSGLLDSVLGWLNLKKSLEKPEHVEESTTASTTRSSFSASPSKECPWMEVEDDTINAVLVGKEFSNSCFMENCTGKPLGEEELMGRGLKDYKKPGDNDKINDCLVERRALNGAKLMEKADHELGRRWAGVVEEIINKSRVSDHKSNGLEDLGPIQTIGSKFRSSSETNKKNLQ
ncbi:hypothetical protein V6N11_028178 [Hibiscus sabdariffa]|uniref:Uncharacterized protein n=2 Tax=Hibiscus sabdariffa TaxID=183260 RepID=A0ABR1Z6Q9_9ROSI